MNDDARLRSELYSALHAGTAGDLRFYRSLTQGASVLELGCGDGRVLAALRGATERWGIDSDPLRLQMAQARLGSEVALLECDMRSWSLGRRFERIVVPHSGLYCLPDTDKGHLFAAVRAHLQSGGVFAFDVWTADAFHQGPGDDAESSEEEEPLVAIDMDGEEWVVSERTRLDRTARHLVATYTYRSQISARTLFEDIDHFYCTRSTLEALLQDAGFRPHFAGGFAGEPWTAESDQTVVTATLSSL